MAGILGKRRTRGHVIADMSVCFVEWQALQCGFAVERVFHDYGIDLEIDTFNDRGEAEPGTILVQVRATDGLVIRPKQAAIPCRVERAHLLRWLSELEPVILVVFDAKKVKAFWVCVQECFAGPEAFGRLATRKTVTVYVPTANRVDPRSMRLFAELKDKFRARSRTPYE